jgi:Ni/Co efflux regulator RcnB
MRQSGQLTALTCAILCLCAWDGIAHAGRVTHEPAGSVAEVRTAPGRQQGAMPDRTRLDVGIPRIGRVERRYTDPDRYMPNRGDGHSFKHGTAEPGRKGRPRNHRRGRFGYHSHHPRWLWAREVPSAESAFDRMMEARRSSLPAPVEAGDPASPDPQARAPLDPQPAFRTVRPRGAPARTPAYEVGKPLPEGRPFVTLDWRAYDLPEPPDGQTYARIRGDIVLIDPDSRRVVETVE